jgi:hypothetical protein
MGAVCFRLSDCSAGCVLRDQCCLLGCNNDYARTDSDVEGHVGRSAAKIIAACEAATASPRQSSVRQGKVLTVAYEASACKGMASAIDV